MPDVPVTPDADTARQWAADELAKDAYRPHGVSIIERINQWISDLFSHLGNLGSGLGGGRAVIATIIVLLLVGAVIAAIVGPMRRSRRRAREHRVFEDDARSSQAMREAAERAASSGDWALAVLERFRAIIRSLEERDLLEERAGMTAHEAAADIGRRFADVRRAAAAASDLFDGVRYGDDDASSGDYDAMVALDRDLADRSILKALAR